jgi:prephenate dehydrogenase
MPAMSEPSFSAPLEETVVIIGVGLIGGSLAAALRQRKLARRVIGVGRDAGRLEQARTLGLIDLGLTDLAEAASMADVMVFCTPVDRVAEGVRIAAAHVHPGTLLTDAGSVKQPICEAVADVPGFIGSHPIAGSHRQGMDAANSELFDGRMCVLTPLPSSEAAQLQRLDRLWRSVGMRTVQMSPSDHDQALAMTSHLPHLVASALAGTLSPQNRLLTGTGFRDSTRIAAGDPELWCGILLQNAEQVCAGIEAIRGRLDSFQAALSAGDAAAVRQLLVEGKQNRDSLENM